MDKLTVGIVGVANFGAYRREQMHAAGCFNIVAVCDRNPTWLATAATEEGATAYEDFEAMMRHDANPNTETADVANVLLHCQSGLVGTLNCYHITGYCHEMRIFGTKGNLYLETHNNRVWFQPRKRNEVEKREQLTIPPAPPEHRYANLLSWSDGIRKGTPVYPGLEDGIASVLPVFAAVAAAADGTQVEIA